MNRHEPDFVALAFDSEVHDALAALHIPWAQRAQLLTADTVIEQDGQYRAVAHAFERIRGRGLKEPPRLRITQGRSAALIVIGSRPLHSIYGIPQNRIAFAQIKRRRQQRK